jgi:pimeloyl-ACP methyl ester carboxylesterase
MRRWMWRFAGLVPIVCIVASALGATYQWIQSRRDLEVAPPPGRLIDVGGYRLHWWCAGQGSPAVIFESGLGGTSFDWYAVRRDVANFTTACAYDRAGLGYSDSGSSPRTSRRIAGELAELVRRSETKLPIVLVGWSDGGLYVRAYASERESQVAGLVLVDAAHEDQAAKFAAAGFPTGPPAFASLVPAAAALGVLRLFGRPFGPRPETEPEPVRRFVQATVYRPSRYRVMLDELTNFSESADEVRALRRPLSIPVVVLSDGRSPIPDVTMPLQRDLLRLSPRSCQMLAAESGHDIAREAPESVVRAIRAAIDAWRTSSTPTC